MRNEVWFSLSPSIFHKTTFLMAAYSNFFVIRMVCSAIILIYWQFYFMRLNIPQFTQFYLRAKEFVYSCSLILSCCEFCIYNMTKVFTSPVNSKFTRWHFTAIWPSLPSVTCTKTSGPHINSWPDVRYKTKIIKLKQIDDCLIIEIRW